MKIGECNKKVGIERIEPFVDRLAKKFYDYKVSNIKMLKEHGENLVNLAWDKRKYPHQKYL